MILVVDFYDSFILESRLALCLSALFLSFAEAKANDKTVLTLRSQRKKRNTSEDAGTIPFPTRSGWVLPG